jgi:hypothetical protein
MIVAVGEVRELTAILDSGDHLPDEGERLAINAPAPGLVAILVAMLLPMRHSCWWLWLTMI